MEPNWTLKVLDSGSSMPTPTQQAQAIQAVFDVWKADHPGVNIIHPRSQAPGVPELFSETRESSFGRGYPDYQRCFMRFYYDAAAVPTPLQYRIFSGSGSRIIEEAIIDSLADILTFFAEEGPWPGEIREKLRGPGSFVYLYNGNEGDPSYLIICHEA